MNSFSDEGTPFLLDGVKLNVAKLDVADTTDHNSQEKNIICLGDSLTFGIGSTPGHDYPNLLSKALGMRVINAGVDGDETEDALKRLDKDVLSKNPRLVVVLLGANDYLNEKPIDKLFENLDEIIRRIQAKEATVVLVEIGPSLLGKDIQDRYNQLVTRRRVPYVVLNYRHILINPFLKSDLLHPNDKGYKIIAKRILKVAKPLLKKTS